MINFTRVAATSAAQLNYSIQRISTKLLVGVFVMLCCADANAQLVTNTTTTLTYTSIQAAINDPLTLNGHTLQVSPGTYIENVVVTKSLMILGPNASINACSGGRFPEAIVVPATNDVELGEIFHVAASNVTISGFTIDGDNTALTSGVTNPVAGADMNAGEGITSYETGINNLTVTNNIIKNLSYFGVTLYDYPAGVPSSGHVISGNKIQDMGTYNDPSPGPNNINFWGGGVLLYNNQYAVVNNNCMDNVQKGVQTGNFYLPNPGAASAISNNTMTNVRKVGIFDNLHSGTASLIALSNNSISGVSNVNEIKWDGILITSISVPSSATGNIINATGVTEPSRGIEVWNVKSTTPAVISGGSITNAAIGVFVNNYDGYLTDATNGAYASIDGLTINSPAGATGIRVFDNPLSTSNSNVQVSLGSGVTINNGLTGLEAENATASVLTVGSTAFNGQTGQYIRLINSPNNIDATSATFDGVNGASGTFAQNFAIEDRILHKIDNGSLGFVTVKANNAFVTDITTPTTINNDYTRIRNGVEAAANNWSVNLKGSFDWTESNAAASWALGNDGTSGTGDDYSILPPANLNGVTFTAPEGLGTATIQGPGDLAGVDLEGVLYFDGSGTNQNWTISNIEMNDFDLAIGMFFGPAGPGAYNGTTITNNRIHIPADLNATVAPADVTQNIGIHYSFGTNQTISNNTFTVDGTGVSAGANYSTSVVMQSNRSGGAAYDGLKIINNTITVTGDPNGADPAVIRGIWENGANVNADIEVSGNILSNASATNLAGTNREFGMWQTSRSGATKNVVYKNNEITGWNTGIASIGGPFQVNTPPDYNTGELPVLVQNNKFDKLQFGVVVRKSVASTNAGSPMIITQNSFTNRVAGGFAISNESSGTTSAPCNWYGASSQAAVLAAVSANVDPVPWLIDGTDTAPATTGFQPVPGACVGLVAVNLSSFTATLSDCNALLRWTTQQEVNSKEYIIEVSKDGNTFTPAGVVKSAGTSVTSVSYSFADKKSTEGVSFYRLKMISNDGHFEYSNVVSINNMCTQKSIGIYPNPVAENQTLEVIVRGAYSGIVKGELFSISGQLVRSFTLQKGSNKIAVKGMSPGIYLMRVTEVSTGSGEAFKVEVTR